MHKAKVYRGWYIPEDATVEVDDKVVFVPQLTISVIQGIIELADASFPKPNIYDSENMLRQWITSRTDLELQALRHYFLDRWTWDTGNDYDKYTNIVAEREIARRQGVADIIAALPPMNLEADFAKLRRTNAQVRAAMKIPSELL